MFAICAGMLRSGSTLQYQVVSHLVEERCGGRRLGFIGLDCLAEIRQEALDNRWRAFKVHEPHQVFSGFLAEGRAKGFYTYRDVRDVVYSMMHRLGVGFEEALTHIERAAGPDGRFWRSQPNTLVQRYEEIVSDGATAVLRIARHLGVDLSGEAAAQIAGLYSLDANRKRTAELTANLTVEGADLTRARTTEYRDRHSELHWNHIREGRIGSWRDRATREEAERLHATFGSWLRENGYEA